MRASREELQERVLEACGLSGRYQVVHRSFGPELALVEDADPIADLLDLAEDVCAEDHTRPSVADLENTIQ